MKRLLQPAKRTAYLLVLLCMIFIPLSLRIASFQERLADSVFGSLIFHLSSTVFPGLMKNNVVISDSLSMYCLVALLAMVALPGGLIGVGKERSEKFRLIIRTLAVYYLAFTLMRYGA